MGGLYVIAMELAQIDPLNAEVTLPVNLYPAIKVGMRTKVILEAPLGGQYLAEVKIIDRVVAAASGTFGVRLELPNPNNRVPAGLKCKVIFPLPGKRSCDLPDCCPLPFGVPPRLGKQLSASP